MVSIGPKIQIQGEDSYRLALRRIIQETKELSSEMDLLTSTFDKNTSTLEKGTRQHQLYAKQVEESEKEVSKIAEGLEKANQKHEDAVKAYDEQAKKLESLKETQSQYQAELKKAWETGSDVSEEMTKKIAANEQAVADAEKETQKYADEVERSGRVLADWETSANKAETELNNLRKGFEDTKPLKVWGEQFQEVGEKMSDFGEQLNKYVTLPLAGLATASVTAAAQFEDGMAKIYTIAMDSTEPMEKMREELIQLSNDTGFSLNDLAEATYQTVSASVDATQATEFMTHAVKLARAGFTTTTRAVDILTTVMNSYGKETYDVEYLTDLLLKTQNDGKVVIDQLASSIGVIIPLAANYHVGIEQIAAAYATMTKQGVPAERATTFMRALFTELENKSKDVAEVLDKETGKSFAQLMDSGASLADVLQILYNKMDKNSEAYQQLFKNVRSGQAAASLAADDFGILNTELDRMQNVAGLTDRALEQMETPALKAKRAVNQLKNSSVELGESMIQKFTPMFEKGTSKIKEMTDAFNKLSPASMETIINAGLLAASIAPLITIGGKLITYVGALMAGTAPLLPLIAGVTAGFVALATAAQVSNIEHMEAIRNEHGLTDAMREQLTEMDAFKTAHEEFQQSMQDRNTATLNEVAYIQELVTQYDALVGKNGEVSEENKATADFILGELATALGMEVSQVKELTDENGKLSQSIQQTIEDYKNEAFAAVMKEELTEATRRKIEAERIEAETTENLKEATLKANDSARELTDAQNAINTALDQGLPVTQDMIDRLADATAAKKLDKEAVDALRDQLFEAQAATSDASEDIEYYTQKLKENAEQAEKTGDKVEQSAKDAETAVKNSASNSETALQNATSGASSAGYNFAKGFADSVDSNAYLGANAASRMGSWASKALNASLQVKSPSRVTAETGKYFVEGFENSIASGLKDVAYLGEMLGMSAAKGLSMGSYLPEAYGNTYNNKTVTAPIAINLTVQGNVDDPNTFARNIADMLADELTKESEVFA